MKKNVPSVTLVLIVLLVISSTNYGQSKKSVKNLKSSQIINQLHASTHKTVACSKKNVMKYLWENPKKVYTLQDKEHTVAMCLDSLFIFSDVNHLGIIINHKKKHTQNVLFYEHDTLVYEGLLLADHTFIDHAACIKEKESDTIFETIISFLNTSSF